MTAQTEVEQKLKKQEALKKALEDTLIEHDESQKMPIAELEPGIFIPFSAWRKQSGYRQKTDLDAQSDQELQDNTETSGSIERDEFDHSVENQMTLNVSQQTTNSETLSKAENELEAKAFPLEIVTKGDKQGDKNFQSNEVIGNDIAVFYASEVKKIKEELAVKHQKELEELREYLVNDMAKAVAQQLETAILETRAILGNEIAKALEGIFVEKLQKEILQEFVEKILAKTMETMTPLKIEGDKELLSALRNMNLLDEKKFIFVETPNKEIRLCCEDQILSTQLQPILNELKELMQ